MNDQEAGQIAILQEIRDLLLPISDHFRPEYERRQAIRALVRSSPARHKAWDLLNGEMGQRQIAQAADMDEGNLSKFFKSLREIGAIKGDPPERTVEV